MPPPIDIEFVLKGIVGTASPVLGVITSFQEQIEWHLRILSLLIGLATLSKSAVDAIVATAVPTQYLTE